MSEASPDESSAAPVALAPAFERGLRAYRAGAYFDAHEHWEEIWQGYPRGRDRQFLQGLIQVAAAMHKVVLQGKPAPAARLIARALPRIEAAPERHWGLAVDRIVREGRVAEAALRDLATSGPGETFDPALVPTIARSS